MNLAPNGKPSNLTPEQYRIVRTPEFKEWFGDWENDAENSSKVVDDNGEPLVVYHGSNKKFYVFDPSKEGLNKKTIRMGGNAIYFSNKERVARMFTDNYGEGYVYPCFLLFKNPIFLDAEGGEISYLNQELKKIPNTKDIIVKNTIDVLDMYKGQYQKDYISDIYITSNPNNIKLADKLFKPIWTESGMSKLKTIGKINTTFDSNNPDIRYKQGANIKNKKMEKETYCVVVVQFDNGVKRTTEVMPKQLATHWMQKYGGGTEKSELFECTSDGEHLRKVQPPKMELGGGVGLVKNEKNEYALYPENPTKKSMGLLLEYGGTMITQEQFKRGGSIKNEYLDSANNYIKNNSLIFRFNGDAFQRGKKLSKSMAGYHRKVVREILNGARKYKNGGKVEDPNEIKAKTYKEWLALMRKDNNEHNQNAHQDDVIPFWEWVSEMGAMYGFKPVKDGSGDTVVIRTQDNPPNKADVLEYVDRMKKVYANENDDIDENDEENIAEDVAKQFNIDILSAYDYFEQTEMKNGGTVGADWQVMFESKKGSKIVSVTVKANNVEEAKSKGWIKSALDKKYFAFLTTYERKELGGNTNPKKKDNDDISQYYDMEFALGGGVPNQKQRDIITQKIGLSEKNADYLIGMSPKFAVWLGDSILKKEIDDYKVGVQTENTDAYIKQYCLNKINERINWISGNYSRGIRVILDWLMHPLTPKQNLRELGFIDAFEKGEEFHKELQALGGDVNFVEDTENEIIKRYQPTEESVEYYWVGMDKGYCDVESRRMGHCGRTGHSGLISLRSIKPYGKGHTINDSHVTIAYEESDHLFYQVKGKKNQKPAEKYHPYIFDLIKTLASDPLHLFMGFGSEYASSEDYGFEDMTKEQVKELYEINPIIFSDFVGEMFLYQSGITTVKPKTTFTMDLAPANVENLLQLSRHWKNSNIIEKILDGEGFDIEEQNWGHYYEWFTDYLDYFDSESDEMIIEEISEITNHPKEKIYKIGILPYLKGEVDDFERDAFDKIIRGIANALSSAEAQDYNKYYYRQLENALNEIGTIEYLNDTGLGIEIELGDLLSSKSISNGLKNLDTNDLEDVFWDATQSGEIELPSFDLDERYDATPQAKDVNRIFKDNGFYG